MDQDQQSLYGSAVDEARTALNAEETRWNEVAGQLRDTISGGAPPTDANVVRLQSQLEGQSNRVAAAERDYANLLEKVAQDSRQRVRSEPTPKQQAVWDAQANNAQALADLHRAQADSYTAKTDDQRAAAKARAQAALQNANTAATRSASQVDQAGAAADLSRARGAQIETLTPYLVKQHQAQIDLIGQRQGLVASQANLADVRAAYISGPQAAAEVSRGNVSQATADYINKSGGAKIQDLIDKGLLDEAHAAQVYANINKQQQAPYADTKAPNLLTFDPRTGTYSAQPNAAYVPDAKQALADEAAAIAALQKQVADGSIQPDEASQLLDNIRRSTAARTAGVTPEQYAARQQTQANFGQSILDKMQSQGNTMADTLLKAANGARTPIEATPYTNAINLAGGPAAIRQALSLIQQVQPISDRAGALDAASKYAQASKLFKDAYAQLQGGGGAGSSTAVSPQPQSQGAPALLPAGVAGTSADPTLGNTPPGAGFSPQPNINDPSRDQGDPNSQAQRLLAAAMSGRTI